MYWVDVITGAVPLVAGLAGMHAARVRFRRRTTVAGQSSSRRARQGRHHALPAQRSPMTSATGQRLEVLVIGSGQAGLAFGLHQPSARLRSQTEDAGQMVSLADGAASEFETMIWASGHGTDRSWIDAPAAKDEFGRISHTRGVTPSPVLYMLGLTGQHTWGSALLGWVAEDAVFITRQITAMRGREQPQ